jgi:hypothetical protein
LALAKSICCLLKLGKIILFIRAKILNIRRLFWTKV